MRIAVCTKNDLFGAIVLNALMPRLADHEVGVFLSVRDRGAEDTLPELDLLRLVERDLPVRVLFPLAESRGAHPLAGEGAMATPHQLAAAAGRPATVVTDMRPEGGTALLEAFAPDMVLSIRFSFLFRAQTIAAVPRGILNVHPGPLPGYRGLFAPFWQMLQGKPVLQCTVHLVDAGMDTGPVLALEEVPVIPDRSLFWHWVQLYLAGTARVAGYVADGVPLARPQGPGGAACGLPSAADFARFRAAGFSVLTGRDYIDLLSPFAAGQ